MYDVYQTKPGRDDQARQGNLFPERCGEDSPKGRSSKAGKEIEGGPRPSEPASHRKLETHILWKGGEGSK